MLKLKQSDWMKNYIDFDMKKKTEAANSFEKKKKKIEDQFCLRQKNLKNLNGKLEKKNQC